MLKKCDGRTDGQTNEKTNLCIELRYAQLIIIALNIRLNFVTWLFAQKIVGEIQSQSRINKSVLLRDKRCDG